MNHDIFSDKQWYAADCLEKKDLVAPINSKELPDQLRILPRI